MKLTLENLPMYCTACGDCLLWNQGVQSGGHPQAHINGKPGVLVRRHLFTELLGQRIPKGHLVTTKCGNRLCLAPEHVITMSMSKLKARDYSEGRRIVATEYASRLRGRLSHGRVVLDWGKVAEIRAAGPEVTNTALAVKFGTSLKTIGNARRGKTWRVSHAASSVFTQGAW